MPCRFQTERGLKTRKTTTCNVSFLVWELVAWTREQSDGRTRRDLRLNIFSTVELKCSLESWEKNKNPPFLHCKKARGEDKTVLIKACHSVSMVVSFVMNCRAFLWIRNIILNHIKTFLDTGNTQNCLFLILSTNTKQIGILMSWENSLMLS